MISFFKRLILFSMFLLLLCPGFTGLTAEEPPDAVVRAAEKGVCAFTAPGKSLEGAPFQRTARTGLDNAELRKGFRMFTAAPVQLMNSQGFTPAITPMEVWRFVLVNENRPTALLTVALVNGQWTAVSVGGAGLAAEVHAVMQKYPAEKGYSMRFVRIFQARADFIEITLTGKVLGFVPLTASRRAFGLEGKFDPGALLHESEILPQLKQRVDEGLRRSL